MLVSVNNVTVHCSFNSSQQSSTSRRPISISQCKICSRPQRRNGLNTSLWMQEATRLYAKAIKELQKRRRIDSYDLGTQHNIILTILVLLVALMVNGSSDFPIVFQMLQSALEVIGGDSKLSQGELAQFLLRQIHK